MTEQLSADHFRPHLTKLFKVRGGRHGLRLTTVHTPSLSEEQRRMFAREPFTLLFEGPAADVLPEGQYAFDVEDGAAFEFYVIPIHTMSRERQDYQAVFN